MNLVALATRFASIVARDQNLHLAYDYNYDSLIQKLTSDYASVSQGYENGTFVNEDDITAAHIRDLTKEDFAVTTLDETTIVRGRFLVRRYRSHRMNKRPAEESLTGADFAVSYILNAPTTRLVKSVLIQAKRAVLKNSVAVLADIHRAQRQAQRMLGFSSSSYLQIYSPAALECYFIPAYHFANTDLPNSMPLDVLLRSVYFDGNRAFYRELLRCRIGDPKLDPERILTEPLVDNLYIGTVTSAHVSLKRMLSP